jgi:hypothetical protein
MDDCNGIGLWCNLAVISRADVPLRQRHFFLHRSN